jgi:MFS family permease
VLTPAVLFELGNVATTMLILRATDLLTTSERGLDAATSIAILMYAGHNTAAMLASPAAGHLCDRVSPRRVLGAGATIYVVSYLAFAFDTGSASWMILGFVLAGIGIGLAETAESTLVAVSLPDDIRGNGFGVLGLIQSFGDLGATVIVGLLWTLISPTVAFVYAALWMFASAVVAYRGRSRVE